MARVSTEVRLAVGALPNAPRVEGLGAYASGDLALADAGNAVVLRFALASGQFSVLAGVPGTAGTADGALGVGTFTQPRGVAVDLLNSVAYVADSAAGSVRAVTSGGAASTLAAGGPLSSPTSLVFSASTAASGFVPPILLFAGGGSVISTISSAGAIATLATLATAGDPALSISALALSASGAFLLTAEATLNCVRTVAVGSGAVAPFAGACGAAGGVLDGAGTSARFALPSGIAVTAAGAALVADAAGPAVRAVSPAGVVATVAGLAGAQGVADGAGDAARFYEPAGLVVAPGGAAYVVDQRPSGSYLRGLE